MNDYEKDVLKQLSKEQLIYLIDQQRHSLFMIGETCVTESKREISSEKAIDKIRDYIYVLPKLWNATEVGGYIDMKLGKISVKEYRKVIGLDE